MRRRPFVSGQFSAAAGEVRILLSINMERIHTKNSTSGERAKGGTE